MEIGNIMWPDGGSTQAYICCDDCGDLVWEMTEQSCSQEGGLKYGTMPLYHTGFFNGSHTTNKKAQS